jgi:hypothetical protein
LPKDHKGNEQFGYKVVELKNLDEDGEEKIWNNQVYLQKNN